MLLRAAIVGALLGCVILSAASLKDCRTVYLRPMPEALDEFVGVELLKWGGIHVVTAEAKADCVAGFGTEASRTDMKSTGSSVLPAAATVERERPRTELPSTNALFLGTRKAAALILAHRESGTVVWADSKSDGWSWTGGARPLAKKLVEQLRKDYSAGK